LMVSCALRCACGFVIVKMRVGKVCDPVDCVFM
jgi:hypothetical protein